MNVLLVAAAAALVVVPGAYGSAFAGPPLSPAGRLLLALALCLGVFLWLFRPARRAPVWPVAVLVLLVGIKLAGAAASTPVGWQGVYEVPDTQPPLLGTFFARFHEQAARIEPRIDFDGAGFGLHFLNDAARYGSRMSKVRRDIEVPLRVTWTGHLRLRDQTRVTFSAAARGDLAISVDGAALLAVTSTTGQSADLRLAAGDHVVTAVYQKPAFADPLVRLGVFDARTLVPLEVTPVDAPGRTDAIDWVAIVTTMLVLLGSGSAVAVFAWMYAPFRLTPRDGSSPTLTLALWASVAAVALFTWWLALPYFGRTEWLWGGGDPLVYEGNARDVMRHGLLMPGAAEGPGRPFYWYPLYAYVLAVAHWLIGDDLGAAVLLNGWSVSLLPLIFWSLGWRRLRARSAMIAIPVLTFFLGWHYLRYALTSFTDCVYLLLAFITIAAASRMVQGGRPGVALATGVLCGLAAATRPSFLTFAPVLVAAMLVLDRDRAVRVRLRLATVLAAGVLLGLLPFAFRNYVVAGQFVALVNSWIQIPYFLIPPDMKNPVGFIGNHPPTLRDSVSMAFTIFHEFPLRTMAVELRKVAVTLGFTQLGPLGMRAKPDLPVIVLLGAVAIWRRAVPRTLLLVVGSFALSHFAAMMIAAPWSSGSKNILPLHATMLFVAGFLGARAAQPIEDRTAGRRSHVPSGLL